MKILIVVFSAFVIMLCTLSFEGGENVISLPMQFSKFEIDLYPIIRITSIIVAIAGFCLVYFLYKYIAGSLWAQLLISITIGASFLGSIHLFGFHKPDYTWVISAILSIAIVVSIVYFAWKKNNMELGD